jgi:hypothetical protein
LFTVPPSSADRWCWGTRGILEVSVADRRRSDRRNPDIPSIEERASPVTRARQVAVLAACNATLPRLRMAAPERVG